MEEFNLDIVRLEFSSCFVKHEDLLDNNKNNCIVRPV